MSATDPAHVAVVIPALNEERAIRGVVESVLAVCPHVIVVDDGSIDATVERIADLPVTLVRHATPLGKGQGLRDGFRKARELGFDAVVAMDGDGQHLASDIPRLLAAARRYPAHIVIGARIRHRENQPPARRRAAAPMPWPTGASRGPAACRSRTPRAGSATTRLPRWNWSTSRPTISCSRPRC
jgi:glycosyltransferase involved in cell wall biosynthesis